MTPKPNQNMINFAKTPKPTLILLLLTILLITSTHATRLDPTQSKPKGNNQHNADPAQGVGGFFGPGTGFDIPGFGQGWTPGLTGGGYGYGYGYGSPSGGHSKGGIIRPTTVCKEKGPCYKKKLRCPAKCFTSFSRSGKGYGGGGGGGGCTIDCEKNCVAYC